MAHLWVRVRRVAFRAGRETFQCHRLSLRHRSSPPPPYRPRSLRRARALHTAPPGAVEPSASPSGADAEPSSLAHGAPASSTIGEDLSPSPPLAERRGQAVKRGRRRRPWWPDIQHMRRQATGQAPPPDRSSPRGANRRPAATRLPPPRGPGPDPHTVREAATASAAVEPLLVVSGRIWTVGDFLPTGFDAYAWLPNA